MTERQRIEKEIQEVSALQFGFRPGYSVAVRPDEARRLATWQAELQAKRRKLMTPKEIAVEESRLF